MAQLNSKSKKSKPNEKRSLNLKKIFTLKSKLWFWPLFVGGCFSIGYSITKSIYISEIFTEERIKLNFNESFKNNNNEITAQKYVSSKHSKRDEKVINPTKQIKKQIYLPSSENSYLSLTIHYSEKENSSMQEVYRNNFSFYQKENVDSLMKTLSNTKKSKSSKIKFD